MEQAKEKRVWTADAVKQLLLTDDRVLYGALKKLYEYQTADERESKETKESNGVGFTAFDAEFMTSVAEFLLKTGFLTESQKKYTRKKILKYSKQLAKIANHEI